MPKSQLVEKEVLLEVTEIRGGMQYGLAGVTMQPENVWYSALVHGQMVDGKFVVDDAALNGLVTKVRAVSYVVFTDEE